MEADYESKESSLRRIGSDSFDSYTGCGCVCRGDGRAGADGKYTSTVCTGAGKPGKSSILCGKNRYKRDFELATGTRDLCGFRHCDGHEQRGSALCKKGRRKKISCEYYESVECFDCITVCENVRYRCVFRGQYFFFAVG